MLARVSQRRVWPDTTSGKSTKQSLAALFAAALLLALLLCPGFNSFETPPIETVLQFATHHQLGLETAPSGVYVQGVDGYFYPTHELGSVLVAVPIAVVANLLVQPTHIPLVQSYSMLMTLLVCVIFALSVALLALLVLETGGSWRTVWTACFILISSQYLLYGLYPSDVSFATPLFLAFVMLSRRDLSDLGWFCLGLLASSLILLKIEFLVTVPVVFALLFVTSREGKRRYLRGVVVLGLGFLPGLILTGWWDYVRTGSVFAQPYFPENEFQLRVLPEGIFGTLISPTKGLIEYSPFLLLLPIALREDHSIGTRATLVLFGTFCLAMIRIAGTEQWASGGGWGIRYYVPWIPLFVAAVALASRAWARGSSWRPVLLALMVAGSVINVSGLLTNFHYRQSLCGYQSWVVPGENVCALQAMPANVLRTAGVAVGEDIVPGASTRDVFVSNRLTTWWYALVVNGVPSWASMALGLGVMLSLAVAGTTAWHLTVGPGGANRSAVAELDTMPVRLKLHDG